MTHSQEKKKGPDFLCLETGVDFFHCWYRQFAIRKISFFCGSLRKAPNQGKKTFFDAIIFLRIGGYTYSKGEVNIEDASVFGRLSHF